MPLIVALLALGAHGQTPSAERVRVQIADRDLPPGTTLRLGDVDDQLRPPELVPDHVVYTADQALGRTTREWILRGEVLREERLVAAGGPTGVLATLPKGLQLLPVELPVPQDWPDAGDWVDLAHAERACLVAEAVHVSAVETTYGRVQTLRTKESAERIFVALPTASIPGVLETGTPRVLLRGPHDLGPASLPSCDAPETP